MNLIKAAFDAFFIDDRSAGSLLLNRNNNNPVFSNDGMMCTSMVYDILSAYSPSKNVANTLRTLVRGGKIVTDDLLLNKLKAARLVSANNDLTTIGYCKAIELLPLNEQLEILKLSKVAIELSGSQPIGGIEKEAANYHSKQGSIAIFNEGRVFKDAIKACIAQNLSRFESLGVHPNWFNKTKIDNPEIYPIRIRTFYTGLIINALGIEKIDDQLAEHRRLTIDTFNSSFNDMATQDILKGFETIWSLEPQLKDSLEDIEKIIHGMKIRGFRETVSNFTEEGFSLGSWPDLVIYDPSTKTMALSEVKYKRDKLRCNQIYFYLNCYPKVSNVFSEYRIEVPVYIQQGD